jgi:peptide chain release factor 1
VRTPTWRRGGVFEAELIDERPGMVTVAFSGVGAKQTFQHESGGHRWQRIPPTEKRGRVQTSTVTVAVFDPDFVSGKPLTYQDVTIETARGSGPGGQKRNKTESCVIVTHKATGLAVRIDNERSQSQNKAMAMKVLAARLYEADRERVRQAKEADRKQQVGTGQRGDKVRTYRTQDDQVTDHRTGLKSRLSRWYNGDWE